MEEKSELIHRDNPFEWRFVGIWADMIKFDISVLKKYPLASCFILFKKYETPLQIIQENLRLRNIYYQYEALYKKDKNNEFLKNLNQMDLDIQNNIDKISKTSRLYIYCIDNGLIIEQVK